MPLKGEVRIINRTNLVQFLREIHPFKKRTPFSNAVNGTITGILLRTNLSIEFGQKYQKNNYATDFNQIFGT